MNNIGCLVPSGWECTRQALVKATGSEAFLGKEGVIPAPENVFAALRSVGSPSRVRVVVLGQDPYPREASATGQAFNDGQVRTWDGTIAPSLRNIIKMSLVHAGVLDSSAKIGDLRAALAHRESPPSYFERTASSGVLWLNTALTYESPDTLRRHQQFWRPIVLAIARDLGRAGCGIVFMLWGAHAQKFGPTLADMVRKEGGRAALACAPHPCTEKFCTVTPRPFDACESAAAEVGVAMPAMAPQKLD